MGVKGGGRLVLTVDRMIDFEGAPQVFQAAARGFVSVREGRTGHYGGCGAHLVVLVEGIRGGIRRRCNGRKGILAVSDDRSLEVRLVDTHVPSRRHISNARAARGWRSTATSPFFWTCFGLKHARLLGVVFVFVV